MTRCVACNRRLPSGARCACGVSVARTDDGGPFLSLEQHFGIEPGEHVRPQGSLTMTFGVPPPLRPVGFTVLRQFRTILEVSWEGDPEVDDDRWNDVFILHYRGPLSGPPWKPVPPLRRLRELHDCTLPLYELLATRALPELRTVELHTPVGAAASVVERARAFPSLQFLVMHFPDAEAGLVTTDALLERYAFLDCRELGRGTSCFSLRR